jgi:ligand-binding sensor domain-containing protein/signal transduction histidine kinase
MKKNWSEYFTKINICFIVKATIAAFYLLCNPASLFSQNIDNLRIEKVQDEGLVNSYVVSIQQDKKGFMWFGTGAGVARYDGYSFKTFQNYPGDSTTLINNTVVTMYTDNDKLWVGTTNGLCNIDINTQKITNFFVTKSLRITSIIPESATIFWIGASSGLYEFNKKNSLLTYVPAAGKNPVNTITDDHRGHLYLSSSGGFYRYDTKPGTSEFYPLDLPTNPSHEKNVLVPISKSILDDKGNLWLSTWDAGLVRFNITSKKISVWFHQTDDVNLLPYKIIMDLLPDRAGNIWLANKEGGLTIFDPLKNKFTNYPVEWKSDNKISGAVISLYRDRSGIVWIGTENGICRYDPHHVYLTKKDLYLKTDSGIFPAHISPISMFRDRDGLLWLGMYEGLFTLNEKTGVLQDRNDLISLSKKFAYGVFSITQDVYGTIWVTAKNLLVKVTKKSNVLFTSKIFSTDDIKSTIYNLFIDNEQRIWLGTHSDGVFRFDPGSNKFTSCHYDVRNSNSKINEIRTFCELSKDSILIGGVHTGLLLFHVKSGKYQKIKLQNPWNCDSDLFIGSIYKSGNDLWIGTENNGLWQTTTTFKSPVIETISDGLPAMSINGVTGDKQNNIWVLTYAGAAKLQAKKITVFDNRDGIQNLNQLYVLMVDKNNNIVIGSRGAIYNFNPDNIIKNEAPPAVCITDMKVFDKDYTIRQGENINLDYNQNYFSFEYVALNYTQSRLNKYAYKMAGLDTKWSYAGARRYVSYANLDEGTYTFYVKACNNEGVWNNVPAKLTLIISPPFWHRWWFYASLFILFTGSVYFIYWYNLNQFKMRLQLRNKIARDLHDDIGSTLSGINIFSKIALQKLQRHEAGSNDLLEKISERSEKIMDALSDIVWSISTKNDHIDNFLVKAREYLAETLEPQGISYSIYVDDISYLKLGMELRKEFYLIFKEAICNASKHAECSLIDIRLTKEKDFFCLTISDNGKGFDLQKTKSGNGLQNMQHRAEKIGAKLEIISLVNKGTSIILSFQAPRLGWGKKYSSWWNKSSFFKSFIAAALLLFNSTLLFSQDIDNLHIEKVQDEGLTNETITCINQDKNGFMWFGTAEGVFRYDGYSFKSFRNIPGDSTTLVNNQVAALYPENNNLWVGTVNGLSCIDVNTQTIKNFILNKFLQINTILPKDDCALWLATSTGLYQFNKINHHLNLVPVAGVAVPVNYMTDDGKGHLYLSGTNGFCCYTIATGASKFHGIHISRYPKLDKNVRFRLNIGRSAMDNDGNLWMATFEAGLVRFNTKNQKIDSWSHQTFDVHILPYITISSVLPDGLGNIWIANREGGLTIFNPAKNKFTNYPVEWKSENKISGGVISLFCDKAGIFWIGTGNGIFKVDPHHVYLSKTDLFLKTDTGFEPVNFSTTAILKDKDGLLWVGTFGGIAVLDEKLGALTYCNDAIGLPRHSFVPVFNVIQDKKEILWMSAKNLLVKIVKKNKTSFKSQIFQSVDIKSTIVNLYIDNEDRIWLGTHSDGVFRFDPVTKKFISYHYDETDPSLKIKEIRAFCELSKDSLLIGGVHTGLILLHANTGKYEKINLVNFSRIEHNFSAYAIYKKGDDLWIGTDNNGLWHTTTRFATPFVLTANDGLPSMTINSIEGDKQNNLWLLTNSGVVSFHIPDKKITVFDKKEGILNQNELNTMTVSSDNNISIAGRGAIYSFNPANIIKNETPPNVFITDMKVFDEDYTVHKLQTIKLDYNQNYFSFDYVALNYTQSRLNKYAYKMDGLDKKWSYVGTRRYVSYANLDEGTYTFYVKACNNEGVWNNLPAKLTLIIAPPFWHRWWFYTLFFVLFVSGTYFLYWYNLNQFKMRLQLRNKIARDLHDDIGSTLSGINIFSKIALQKIKHNEIGSSELLEKISDRSEKTMDALSDIVWSISTKNDRIDNFLVKAREYLAETLEPQGIRYEMQIDEDISYLKLGMELRKEFYLIFKEAICNASKYAQCSLVEICLTKEKDLFCLTIRDNGKGFDKNKMTLGNGLQNMQHRAEKMKAKLEILSQVSEGTSIILSFHIPRFR